MSDDMLFEWAETIFLVLYIMVTALLAGCVIGSMIRYGGRGG